MNDRSSDEKYFCGLDLGQAADFTALAAVCRSRADHPEDVGNLRRRLVHRYRVRGLKRYPLGTDYVSIVADVKEVVSREPLRGCTLVVDATGVGRPIVDLLRKEQPPCTLLPVLITAGARSSLVDGYVHLAKRELVSTLQLQLQNRRVEIPDSLPDAEALTRELLAFRVKITAAKNEVFENDWRHAPHDDLVLAAALAVWAGERSARAPSGGRPFVVPLHQPGRMDRLRRVVDILNGGRA